MKPRSKYRFEKLHPCSPGYAILTRFFRESCEKSAIGKNFSRNVNFKTMQCTPLQIFVIGGYSNIETHTSVEKLNVRRNMWIHTTPMNIPRHGCAAHVIGPHIYVVGGTDGLQELVGSFSFFVNSWVETSEKERNDDGQQLKNSRCWRLWLVALKDATDKRHYHLKKKMVTWLNNSEKSTSNKLSNSSD